MRYVPGVDNLSFFQVCLERPKGKGMLVKLKGKATDDVYVGPVIALQANKALRTFT